MIQLPPADRSLLAVGLLVVAACGNPAATIPNPPFREAIGKYVQSNNMAMKIKEIKQGPTVVGDTAKLQASMVHEQLGGPSVTWEFHFEKQGDVWQVTSHHD